jgi:drug/metabolite transporter (DMT)-like permease
MEPSRTASRDADAGSGSDKGAARRGDWLVLFSAACFSTMPIFGNRAYAAGIDLVSLLAWRFLLSTALLWVFLVLTRRAASLPPARVAGFLGMGLAYLAMSFIYFRALELAPVSTLTLLFYTYPIFVTLLAALLLREPLTRIKLLALVLAAAGCVVVLRPTELGDGRGAALALLASLMYSGFLLVGTPLIRGVDAILATAWILSVCALGYSAAAWVRGRRLPPLGISDWGIVLGIAVVATVMADVSFFYGLTRTGASRAAILSTLEPVCTLLLAAALLGEGIPVTRLLGGGLILGSVVMIHRE